MWCLLSAGGSSQRPLAIVRASMTCLTLHSRALSRAVYLFPWRPAWWCSGTPGTITDIVCTKYVFIVVLKMGKLGLFVSPSVKLQIFDLF